MVFLETLVGLMLIGFIAILLHHKRVSDQRIKNLHEQSESFRTMLELTMEFRKIVQLSYQWDEETIKRKNKEIEVLLEKQKRRPSNFNSFQTENIKRFMKCIEPEDDYHINIQQKIYKLMRGEDI